MWGEKWIEPERGGVWEGTFVGEHLNSYQTIVIHFQGRGGPIDGMKLYLTAKQSAPGSSTFLFEGEILIPGKK